MSSLKTSLKIGLQILETLARSHKQAVPVRELSLELQQSEKYLEQLLLPLRRARLVTSTRGPHGGYRLARETSEISLWDVLALMQGPLIFCDCPNRSCGECVSPAVWQTMESCIESSMARVTLADVMASRQPEVPARLALGSTWVQDGMGI